MKIGITTDCPDPDQLAPFWEQFLGYARRPHRGGGPYVTIDRPDGADGPPHVTFQRVPEAKTHRSRCQRELLARPNMDAAAVVRLIASQGPREDDTRLSPFGNNAQREHHVVRSDLIGGVEAKRSDRRLDDCHLSGLEVNAL
jgi:hypothetical protein